MSPQEQSPPVPMHPLLARQYQISRILEYVATHDSLTGLLNKDAWKANIEERIDEGEPFGVAFMDMNSFKRINDEHGHDRGDQVLKEFGEFLASRFHRSGDVLSHERLIAEPDTENTDPSSTLSRWAGDEFGFTFSISDGDRRGIDPATGKTLTVAERVEAEAVYLRAAIAEFVAMQPDDIRKLDFDVSIGTAYWDPGQPVSADQLFSIVDKAMFANKAASKEALEAALPLRKRIAKNLGERLLGYAGFHSRR